VSVSLSVRSITPDELVAWIDVMNVAFHSNRSPEAGAAFRRELRADDYSRNLAAFDGARLVGTYESFHAELTLPGGDCLPTNAVTAVSVLPTHHRRGALTRMMTRDLQLARERGEAASILIAAEYPIYARFGFGPATDHAAYTLDALAAEFTPTASVSGSVELVEPQQMREVAPSLFERFRRRHPGQIDRRPFTWDTRLGLRPSPWRSKEQHTRCAVYSSSAGEPEGYLMYDVHGEWTHHVPDGRLEVEELVTLSDAAYAGLWRYMAEIDLVTQISAEMRRVDEPLAWMLTNPRRALRQTNRADFLWVRPMDTPRLLEARRYAADERLVFELDDPLGLAGGRFVVEGGPEGGRCQGTDASADVRLGMPALSALSLGGVSAHLLHAAGRLDAHSPDAIERTERLFRWPIAPWCSTFF
jgi:predicted acetyltransferase